MTSQDTLATPEDIRAKIAELTYERAQLINRKSEINQELWALRGQLKRLERMQQTGVGV